MKKTDELKQIVAQQRAEVEKLQAAEQWDDAVAAAKKLNDAVAEYKAAAALEASDLENFLSGAEPTHKPQQISDAKLRNRVFNKLVLGRRLDEQEAACAREYFNSPGTPGLVEATPAKGGYLVPEEQFNTIREFRRAYMSLKEQCNIIPVTKPSGKMPTMGEEKGKLTSFEELTAIQQSDFDFGQMSYATKDYGDIIPVSNQLLADADVDLMGIVGRRFARKSINTENEEILKILGGISASAITDWKGLAKAINVTLDPAISAGAVILTNQDGLQWLDEMTDDNKRPLLTHSLADATQLVFKGRRIIVAPNSLLPTKTKKIPFYVGSITDAVTFFDRAGVEVAVSTEFLFDKYATALRCVERFDVKKDDAEALLSLQFTTT